MYRAFCVQHVRIGGNFMHCHGRRIRLALDVVLARFQLDVVQLKALDL